MVLLPFRIVYTPIDLDPCMTAIARIDVLVPDRFSHECERCCIAQAVSTAPDEDVIRIDGLPTNTLHVRDARIVFAEIIANMIEGCTELLLFGHRSVRAAFELLDRAFENSCMSCRNRNVRARGAEHIALAIDRTQARGHHAVIIEPILLTLEGKPPSMGNAAFVAVEPCVAELLPASKC